MTVEGNQMEIWVAQAGATAWRAWGFYNSKHIEARGLTVVAAAETWKTKATTASKTVAF